MWCSVYKKKCQVLYKAESQQLNLVVIVELKTNDDVRRQKCFTVEILTDCTGCSCMYMNRQP